MNNITRVLLNLSAFVFYSVAGYHILFTESTFNDIALILLFGHASFIIGNQFEILDKLK